ncbi:hypothetical protein EH196_09620 [Bacillus sp. C1-1]|nr:hypothetical protein EH196_09620 [Bacillus sp. C1-1]
MTLPAISQWNAFMIETLRANGMKNEKLLELLKHEDTEGLNEFDQTFDYHDLVEYATENATQIEEAIQTGYKIKFASNYGIKRLLRLKYGLEEGTDYKMTESRFDDILLSQEQLQEFTSMLSPNWTIVSEQTKDTTVRIHILHATLVN